MDDAMVSMRMVRRFAAPPARVFEAWVDPELIRRWMSGGEYSVTEVEVDARVNGPYRIVVTGPEGSHITTGRYLALEPASRVEMTWAYEGPHEAFAGWESTVTVTLAALADGGTEMTLVHSRLVDESAKDGYREGWAGCMKGMEAIFEGPGGITLHETAVRFERILPGPMERVWAHMTEREQLANWLGRGFIEPNVGGAVDLEEGHIRGTVTQWNPPHRLAFTWNVFAPGENTSAFPESYVTFELREHGDDVLLTLTHRPILDGFDGMTLMGWNTILDLFGALVRGETPDPRAQIVERNRVRYRVEKARLEAAMAKKAGH